MGSRDEGAIRARAYQLWAQSGYIDGQHDQHWRQAEQELGGADEPAGDAAAPTPAPPARHADGVSALPSMDSTDDAARRSAAEDR